MNMTPEGERDALIDRYVNGKLTEEEEAEFEVRMMDEQELFEEVQVTEALKRGLLKYADLIDPSIKTNSERPNTGKDEDVETTNVLPFKIWLRQPLSLAASVVVAALGLQAIYTNLKVQPGTDNDVMAVGSLLLLENTRGASPLQFSGAPPYLLQIDAGLGNPAGAYSVTLRSTVPDVVVLEQQGLHADVDGWVRLMVNARLAGFIQVELAWVDAQGANQTREFAVEIEN